MPSPWRRARPSSRWAGARRHGSSRAGRAGTSKAFRRRSVPETSTLLLFGAAALALIVVPGPAVLYIVAQSIDRGRLAGVVSALGIAVGGLVHVAAAAIGLSAVLVSSATAVPIV